MVNTSIRSPRFIYAVSRRLESTAPSLGVHMLERRAASVYGRRTKKARTTRFFLSVHYYQASDNVHHTSLRIPVRPKPASPTNTTEQFYFGIKKKAIIF